MANASLEYCDWQNASSEQGSPMAVAARTLADSWAARTPPPVQGARLILWAADQSESAANLYRPVEEFHDAGQTTGGNRLPVQHLPGSVYQRLPAPQLGLLDPEEVPAAALFGLYDDTDCTASLSNVGLPRFAPEPVFQSLPVGFGEDVEDLPAGSFFGLADDTTWPQPGVAPPWFDSFTPAYQSLLLQPRGDQQEPSGSLFGCYDDTTWPPAGCGPPWPAPEACFQPLPLGLGEDLEDLPLAAFYGQYDEHSPEPPPGVRGPPWPVPLQLFQPLPLGLGADVEDVPAAALFGQYDELLPPAALAPPWPQLWPVAAQAQQLDAQELIGSQVSQGVPDDSAAPVFAQLQAQLGPPPAPAQDYQDLPLGSLFGRQDEDVASLRPPPAAPWFQSLSVADAELPSPGREEDEFVPLASFQAWQAPQPVPVDVDFASPVFDDDAWNPAQQLSSWASPTAVVSEDWACAPVEECLASVSRFQSAWSAQPRTLEEDVLQQSQVPTALDYGDWVVRQPAWDSALARLALACDDLAQVPPPPPGPGGRQSSSSAQVHSTMSGAPTATGQSGILGAGGPATSSANQPQGSGSLGGVTGGGPSTAS